MYPLPARMIRLISHRNALRISYTALAQPWLPSHVYPPPMPAIDGILNIGYVSNDVKFVDRFYSFASRSDSLTYRTHSNHPLSHLMLSVFKLHDRRRFRVFLYTSSPWDGSSYRPKISGDVEVFVDASTWTTQQIVEHITQNRIHVREYHSYNLS